MSSLTLQQRAEYAKQQAQKNARAYKLICDNNGMTYNELRELHLHGTLTIMEKIGMVQRNPSTGKYVATKRPTTD